MSERTWQLVACCKIVLVSRSAEMGRAIRERCLQSLRSFVERLDVLLDVLESLDSLLDGSGEGGDGGEGGGGADELVAF